MAHYPLASEWGPGLAGGVSLGPFGIPHKSLMESCRTRGFVGYLQALDCSLMVLDLVDEAAQVDAEADKDISS